MQIEGGPRTMHGGPNNADNSGVLSYVRVEFAGYPFEEKPGDQWHHLRFGRKRHANRPPASIVCQRRCLRMVRRNGSCGYLVAYHCWDDDFDIDNGYSGTCRHLLGIRHPRIADITGSHAFECSNNGTNTPATPTTAATFEDVTIDGPASGDASFVNHPDFINGGGLRPENESMLGLFGAALYMGNKHRRISGNCRISGYPSDMVGHTGLSG